MVNNKSYFGPNNMKLINQNKIQMGKVTVGHGSKNIDYIFLINDLEVPMMDIRN